MTVAAFAAVGSYSHIYNLALRYGQTELESRILPLSIDGEILAVSLMMLHCSRRGREVPLWVRAMLWVGVAVTLVANAADGVAHRAAGMTLSVITGLSFVAVVEGLMWYIRDRRKAKEDVKAEVSPVAERVAQDAQEAAYRALRDTWAAGNPYSQRQILARFGIKREEDAALRVRVKRELGIVDDEPEPVLEYANGDSPAGA